MVDITPENKFDFFRERLEIGQFCLLVELNLELCTIILQLKQNTAIASTFTFLLRGFVSENMYAEWEGK